MSRESMDQLAPRRRLRLEVSLDCLARVCVARFDPLTIYCVATVHKGEHGTVAGKKTTTGRFGRAQ